MNWQQYDSDFSDGDDFRTGRPRRTKFKQLENFSHANTGRIKRSGKRSHRQKTIKDDYWAEHDR